MRACAAALALLALAGMCSTALAQLDAFAAKDRALMQWLKDGGGELHQVVYSVVGADAEELDEEDGVVAARRGLFAKEALSEGAVAVRLPAKLALALATSSMPHKERLNKLARRQPECALAAALLWEKHAPDSPWAPYIQTLPMSLASVAFARSAAARAALVGSHAAHFLSTHWVNEGKCYRELESALFHAQPADFPPATFSAGAAAWALATVRARSLPVTRAGSGGGDEPALLPMAELLPRGAARGRACAGAGASWRGGGASSSSSSSDVVVEVRVCATRRGQEAALPRGALSDAHALAYRGALPPGSAKDAADDDAVLPIRLPTQLNTDDDAAARAVRHAAVRRCGNGGDARGYTKFGATAELLCAVRAAQVPIEALRAASPPNFAAAADDATEAAALDALVQTAEDLLGGFASSPDEDRATLARIRTRGGGEAECAADDEVACRREATGAALREKLVLLAARDALADMRDAIFTTTVGQVKAAKKSKPRPSREAAEL